MVESSLNLREREREREREFSSFCFFLAREAPLHSRSMDDKDGCLFKERISIPSNPAAIARRKRIEIRRFKKFSYNTDLVRRDSNTAQIPSHLKRARSSVDELDDSWEDMGESGNPSPKLKKEDICVQTIGKKAVEFTEQQGHSAPTSPEGNRAAVPSSDPACHTTAHRFHIDMVQASEQLSTSTNDDLQDPKFFTKEDIQDGQAVFGDFSSHCDMEVDCAASPAVVPYFAQSKACTSWRLCNQRCPLSGKLLLCGQRREMKDRVAIVPYFVQLCCDLAARRSCLEKVEGNSTQSLHFFAVYDCHGGSQASQFCMERLHLMLAEELATLCVAKDANGNIVPCDWKSVMALCFLRMDKELRGLCPKGHCDDEDSSATYCNGWMAPESLGTSAVVVVLSSHQIVVASCGNCRAVLSRGGKAIPLSLNHKPEREDETNRVEAAGGQCNFWDHRNAGGLLAPPRAMGDLHFNRFILSEPVVTCIQRSEEDECLILASNGLWDVINDDATCEIARKRLASARSMRDSGIQDFGDDPASVAAAALLVKVALGRGSKDNISVVVGDLKT